MIIVILKFRTFIISLLGSTKTQIISPKAMQALENPVQRLGIQKAFAKAEQDFKITGVWKDPEYNL